MIVLSTKPANGVGRRLCALAHTPCPRPNSICLASNLVKSISTIHTLMHANVLNTSLSRSSSYRDHMFINPSDDFIESGRSPRFRPNLVFNNKPKNRSFTNPSLANDAIGKEADWETNIGDK
jgi:hypothetical protein